MPDHALSSDPAVQAQLDRLSLLSPGADVLGLDRITTLLARLGDPHLSLPPVFHVAGTNGKGSTCAFLRAAIEASGHSVHVYSSPHLVRFNERIRVAGTLIDDADLAALLGEVLDHAGGLDASFFEITTAAAFLTFARTPAAATIVEVGLGGRLDATNVIPAPVVTGIAALGIDHVSFLGETMEAIAAEKAGIAKPGVPLVTMEYPGPVAATIARIADARGAPLIARGQHWTLEAADRTMRYQDAGFSVVTDLPRLIGSHQPENLGLAVAMLRHQGAVHVPEAALRAAADWASWPARMQRLDDGPVTARLPGGSVVWLDGAHNPSAARVVGRAFRDTSPRDLPRILVIGMLANKDADGVLAALADGLSHVVAVPVSGHDHHPPEELAARALHLGIPVADTAPSVAAAFAAIDATRPGAVSVLVAGSLYLAGTVLADNGQPPA